MLGFKTPMKTEYLQILDSPTNILVLFLVFSFSVQKHCDGELFLFFLQLLEQHAVWLEDLFKLLKNFDPPDIFLFLG
jgi:hypothetical protein